MNLNTNGITDTILNPIDKHATLAGAGFRLIEKKNVVLDSLNRAMGGHIHAPDLEEYLTNISNDGAYASSALLIIVGELMKSSRNNILTKIGNIASKGGIAYLASGLAILFFHNITHSDGGVSATEKNFLNAPLAQRYYP